MRSRIGSTILLALLYSQAAFGLVALGAVIMKDDNSQRAAIAPAAVVAAIQASRAG